MTLCGGQRFITRYPTQYSAGKSVWLGRREDQNTPADKPGGPIRSDNTPSPWWELYRPSVDQFLQKTQAEDVLTVFGRGSVASGKVGKMSLMFQTIDSVIHNPIELLSQ